MVNQTGTSGYITSPNYPNNYTNLDLREYYITAPSTYNTVRIFIILLTFLNHILLAYCGRDNVLYCRYSHTE